MRLLVVGHRCTGMMPVAVYDDAAATLAGEEVSEEGLSPDAMRTAPAWVGIELSVLLGFR